MQRRRLLAATLRECASGGSENLTVAGVVRAAGVSRRTFYEFFTGLSGCLLAAIEDCLEQAEQAARDAFESREIWSEAVRAGLAATLAHFEREPEAARVLVVETLRAGPEVTALRRRVVSLLAAVLEEGGAAGKPGTAICSLTGEATVGAVLAVLHDRLDCDRRPKLGALLGELMCIVMAPYRGLAAARRELQRPAMRTPSRSRAQGQPLTSLPMRLTYRTMRVLLAIGQQPGASNRQVGTIAGIEDQGQCSKMLMRLQRLGLIENAGSDTRKHSPNAWRLTANGSEIERELAARVQL